MPSPMDMLLTQLRASAEPTRLRVLALAARGSFCVMDFCEVLDQSQPRLSRHLRLLTDAGLLARLREGPNVWFALPPSDSPGGALARALLARLPPDDPILADDRRHAARVLAERARAASASFRAQGAEWEEATALGLPTEAVEQALLALLPDTAGTRLLDIGTGTGRLLELVAPRVAHAVGVDASRAMLALARARLARTEAGTTELAHCAVRLGDMYRLPFADGSFDVAVMQMLLHHAEEPAAALTEAARVLRPGGRLVVIDLARHEDSDVLRRFAHRWPGFAPDRMGVLLEAAGFAPAETCRIVGTLDVCLWSATRIPAANPLASQTVLEDA